MYPPPGKLNSGKAFVWIDRYLDTAVTGPTYLAKPEIAQIVAESIRRGVDLGHYDLVAWVVMSNHVHLLISPKVDPSRLLASLKGYTARQANSLLGRTGQPFWQAESYDHVVRNQQERERIIRYIEQNPVKAGLVQKEPDYPWSSAATPRPHAP